MHLRSVLVITLVCFLAFSLALPGRNAKLRKERKLQQLQREPEQVQEQKQHFVEQPVEEQQEQYPDASEVTKYTVEVTQDRGTANKAYLLGVLMRYNWNSNLQTFMPLIAEFRDNNPVRLSVCRLATRKRVTSETLYSDKYACRDISNVGFSNSKSEYDDLVTIFDNVFQDAERPDISRSKMKMNENLSFRLIRKSGVQDVMVQFRFDRSKRYSTDSSTFISLPENQWSGQESNDNFNDWMWTPPNRRMGVLIGTHEWVE